MALNGNISSSAMALLNEIYDMYATISLGASSACIECSQYSAWQGKRVGPCPIFHIGNNYGRSGDRIVFVASQPYGLDNEDGKGGGISSVAGTRNPDYSNHNLPRVAMINWMEIDVQQVCYDKSNSIYKPIVYVCKDKNKSSPQSFFEEIAILNLFPCYVYDSKGSNIKEDIRIRHRCNCPEEDKKLGNDLFYRILKILKPKKVAMIGNKDDEWIVERVCRDRLGIVYKPFGHVSGLNWTKNKITLNQYMQRILDFIK